MAEFRVEFRREQPEQSIVAEFWELDDGAWFDFYGDEAAIVATVNASEVLAITRLPEPEVKIIEA